MDFIEHFLGISPDGGNGVLEAVYFAAIFTLLVMIFWRRLARLFVARPKDDLKAK